MDEDDDLPPDDDVLYASEDEEDIPEEDESIPANPVGTLEDDEERSKVDGVIPSRESDEETIEEVTPRMRWHAAVFPEGETPHVQSAATLEDFIDILSKLQGQNVYVIPFEGDRLFITKGPWRRLLLANGEKIDIYWSPDENFGEIQEDGFLGDVELDPADSKHTFTVPSEMPTLVVKKKFSNEDDDSPDVNVVPTFPRSP